MEVSCTDRQNHGFRPGLFTILRNTLSLRLTQLFLTPSDQSIYIWHQGRIFRPKHIKTRHRIIKGKETKILFLSQKEFLRPLKMLNLTHCRREAVKCLKYEYKVGLLIIVWNNTFLYTVHTAQYSSICSKKLVLFFFPPEFSPILTFGNAFCVDIEKIPSRSYVLC